MIFGKRKKKDFNEQITLNSIPMKEKPDLKHLGVHIDSNKKFQGKVEHILRKLAQSKKEFLL